MSTSAVINRKDLLRAGKHQQTATFGSVVMAVAVILSMLTSPTIAAPEAGLSRTLDGLTIYLGVIASEIASEHLPAHPEAQMHGGKRPGKRFEHVVIAVYDAKTNERVTDATVKASVRDPGLNVEEKTLESMTIANTLSYCNYFAMKPKTRYVILVSVRRPGQHQATQAQFDYSRQWRREK